MSDHAPYDILVCSGPTCAGVRHADQVYQELERELLARELMAAGRIGRRKCFGFCRRGPNVYVRTPAHRDAPPPPWRSALYHGVAARDIPDIVHTHVLGGRVLERLLQIPEDPDSDLDPASGHGREDVRLAVVPLADEPARTSIAAGAVTDPSNPDPETR